MRQFIAGGMDGADQVEGSQLSCPAEIWYYRAMANQKNPSGKAPNAGFVLGRERFAKISAVEGIELSPAMKKRMSQSDQKGLSAAARRGAIIRAHRKD
jgi:hypothetical protein